MHVNISVYYISITVYVRTAHHDISTYKIMNAYEYRHTTHMYYGIGASHHDVKVVPVLALQDGVNFWDFVLCPRHLLVSLRKYIGTSHLFTHPLYGDAAKSYRCAHF